MESLSDNLRFATTGDGSKTLWNETIGEHYHSRHGALQESLHVFVNSGLEYWLQKEYSSSVEILEVGFGTGLNFLLTSDYCKLKGIELYFNSIEAFPLSTDVISQTGYDQFVSENTWTNFISQYTSSFNHFASVEPQINLQIHPIKLEDFAPNRLYDVIYFDAFAAVHQPEMWDEKALEITCRNLKKGGVFVTYAITGHLKRTIKSLGFSIEKAKGAPGKREMLRAIKL